MRLCDLDFDDLGCGELIEYVGGDPSGDFLDEVVRALALDDLLRNGEDLGVVECVVDVVRLTCLAQVGLYLDVDHERLA